MAGLVNETVSQYLEAIEDDARCNFQFDMTGGSGRTVYHTPAGSNYDLQTVLRQILGYTNPNSRPNEPNLNRLLPVTHPKFPYLYAHRISSVIGKGSGTASQVDPTQVPNPAIGTKPIAKFYHYPQYELGIEFASRPYPVIDDAAFSLSVNGSWYKKDGSLESFTYSPEWARYCEYDFVPQDNTIQGQQGSLSLWGVPPPGGGASVPIPFQSPPWMWLPDMLLKIRWYQVPFRFLTSTNSYIAGGVGRNWRGRVNQNWFWNWPPGSLLYLGYSYKRYTPPFLDINTNPSFTGAYNAASPTMGRTKLGDLINYERLCDIELTFLYTSRFRKGSLGVPLMNLNYIPEGHNLMPNLADNSFYYATRTPVGSSDPLVQHPPAWFSFPVEILFSDPDAGNGPTTTGDN